MKVDTLMKYMWIGIFLLGLFMFFIGAFKIDWVDTDIGYYNPMVYDGLILVVISGFMQYMTATKK